MDNTEIIKHLVKGGLKTFKFYRSTTIEINGIDIEEYGSIADELVLEFEGVKARIRFINCSFNNFEIKGNSRVYFDRCKFGNVEVTGHYLNFNECHVSDNLTFESVNNFHFRNGYVAFFTILTDNKDHQFLRVKDSNFQHVNIRGASHEEYYNEFTFESCRIDYLTFYGYERHKKKLLHFGDCTIKEEYKLIKSDLGKIEFSSCDFSDAVHLIASSSYDEGVYGNTKWFKRIYYPNEKKSRKFLGVELSEDFRRAYGEIHFLGLSRWLKYFKYKEYYEGYRQYKLISSKNKNRPDEIYFKAKEYNARFKQMDWFSSDFTDKLILGLNALSNGHGRFWMRPIFWNIVIGMIFYFFVLKYSTLDQSGQSFYLYDNFKGFLNFLNPTHKFDFLGDEIVLGRRAYLIDWVYRVISAFLIFQTISAFRKYKD